MSIHIKFISIKNSSKIWSLTSHETPWKSQCLVLKLYNHPIHKSISTFLVRWIFHVYHPLKKMMASMTTAWNCRAKSLGKRPCLFCFSMLLRDSHQRIHRCQWASVPGSKSVGKGLGWTGEQWRSCKVSGKSDNEQSPSSPYMDGKTHPQMDSKTHPWGLPHWL